MFYSISTLLTRNLHDVFGENDPARRRAAIDEIFAEDCVFYDPKGGVYRGRDEIDRIAGAVKATHPNFRYQPTDEPEEVGNGGRVQWVSGRPVEAPAYADNVLISARFEIPMLSEHLPNALLMTYPNAAHGSLFQFHESFVRQAAQFLDSEKIS